MLEIYGSSRHEALVMLGSDYPQISLTRMVEALEKLDLTNEEKTAILSGNARRILGAAGKEK